MDDLCNILVFHNKDYDYILEIRMILGQTYCIIFKKYQNAQKYSQELKT